MSKFSFCPEIHLSPFPEQLNQFNVSSNVDKQKLLSDLTYGRNILVIVKTNARNLHTLSSLSHSTNQHNLQNVQGCQE